MFSKQNEVLSEFYSGDKVKCDFELDLGAANFKAAFETSVLACTTSSSPGIQISNDKKYVWYIPKCEIFYIVNRSYTQNITFPQTRMCSFTVYGDCVCTSYYEL